jgi:leucyl aminopeptidase
MKFTLDSANINEQHADCLIVGIYEKGELTPSANKLDRLSKGYLSTLCKQLDFQGKLGQSVMLNQIPRTPAPHILLIGCGPNVPLNPGNYRKIITASVNAILKGAVHIAHAASYLTELEVEKFSLPWKIKQAVHVSGHAAYRFDQFKSKKEPADALKEMAFYVPLALALTECKKAMKEAIAILNGVEFTKNLANLPSNICTPSYLADQAKKLSKAYKTIKTKVLEEKDMKKLGMGALLAVSQGSAQPAKLITLEYNGPKAKKKKAPIVLVGKGITFDTGGISLKSSDSMVGMKYDMCGAATVLGTIVAAAELKLPLHLVGVIASAENMPGGKAVKPEDIVTTLSGQTVEILNTDAEGRLVLCDALTYCERFKPAAVIDIATLTGAVVIALGMHATGLLSNYEPLAKDLLEAGLQSYDRAWQLPLWEDYQEQLKSPFADMSNTGGRAAGTITAACFLSRFAKKFHWAHLDVAGTAAMMMGGNDRYATGRPVPLLVQYLMNQCDHHAKN